MTGLGFSVKDDSEPISSAKSRLSAKAAGRIYLMRFALAPSLPDPLLRFHSLTLPYPLPYHSSTTRTSRSLLFPYLFISLSLTFYFYILPSFLTLPYLILLNLIRS
jgi:hypothetical protein